MKTVKQLKDQVRQTIWASGEAENLVTAHDVHFQQAFSDIAQWVECERDDNVNVIEFCKTNYKMGMTIVPKPPGIVTRVWTVANRNFDDPVFLRQALWPEPETWARNLFLFQSPAFGTVTPLPLGFQNATSANDSAYGRARTGIWSIYQNNIYIAPWIQSNELIVIEWKGIKEKWEDTDLINPEIMYAAAVQAFMQHAHDRDYGEMDRALYFYNANTTPATGVYAELRGNLMWECRERTKLRKTLSTGAIERNRLCAELADDWPVIPDNGLVIADLGKVSKPGADLDKIATLAKSWAPQWIIASGLIGQSTQNYDATAGLEFSGYISPYQGVHGAGGSANTFWPAPAHDDWTKDSLASFLAFFPTPNGARYYDVCLGAVHLFVLDTEVLEPDGNLQDSAQGQWLRSKLALSTAKWKVVKMWGAPFGSLGDQRDLQWSFKGWGADLVLSSGNSTYERFEVGGLPYINNGSGSELLDSILVPSPYLKFSYTVGYGAGRITVTDGSLLYEFFTEAGAVIDSLQLNK